MAEQEINRDVMIQLPIWAQQRITLLQRMRTGRRSHFHLVMKPFDHDLNSSDVELFADTMVELKRKLSRYQNTCRRL